MLAAARTASAKQVAVRDGATTLTYAELGAAARTFAAALVEDGVEPGDAVAIWCVNCAEWVVAVLGLLAAGAVLVPVNTRFKAAEAADLLARSRARALVTMTDFLGTDYVAMLETGSARCRRSRRWSRHGAGRRAGPSPGTTSSVGPRRRRRSRCGDAARRSGPTTRPTSSSPRGRRACRRAS